MTKRFQIILTITAIISFILAFILEITSFGQDPNMTWKDIEILRILSIVALVLTIGLLLGLFLFYKQKYKNRILLTIPIAFILFAVADISKTIISYYGLDEEYNYFSAKQDIKKGKIQILETGLISPEPNVDWNKKQEAEKKIEKQINISRMSCNKWHWYLQLCYGRLFRKGKWQKVEDKRT